MFPDDQTQALPKLGCHEEGPFCKLFQLLPKEKCGFEFCREQNSPSSLLM
jgi:hypothetical protein